MLHCPELTEFESLAHLYVSNGALVIEPHQGQTLTACDQIPKMVQAFLTANPDTHCFRVFVLFGGEYLEMQLENVLLFS
ncbi:hypothetical protein LEP3755_43040 [Leptolyngbya sp. NIES-3755]|nr:hypothetical protein LEP3755_43040 [Leptolyngbya sp. NIES-3755]